MTRRRRFTDDFSTARAIAAAVLVGLVLWALLALAAVVVWGWV